MVGVPLGAFLALAIFLFTVGAVGVIVRRNPIVIFMCVELMLNAVNLTALAFARYRWSDAGLAGEAGQRAAMGGQIMVIFIMAVAATEVAVGLGIIMAIFRRKQEIDIDELNLLKG